MINLHQAKLDIIEAGRRTYDRGYVASNDGNISCRIDDDRIVTQELVRAITDEELASIRDEVGDDVFQAGRWQEARRLFERVALADDFEEFLTIPAYAVLEDGQ